MVLDKKILVKVKVAFDGLMLIMHGIYWALVNYYYRCKSN